MRTRVPILVTLAVALLVTGAASASTVAPLTWATACASDLDVAGCERTTWIANKLDDPAPVASSTVSLDDSASNRLDLAWWGEWAVVGVLLAMLVAPAWRAVFPWGKSGGAV
jgi:hypothetical protein